VFAAPAEAGGADGERCGGAEAVEEGEDAGLGGGRAVEEEEGNEMAGYEEARQAAEEGSLVNWLLERNDLQFRKH